MFNKLPLASVIWRFCWSLYTLMLLSIAIFSPIMLTPAPESKRNVSSLAFLKLVELEIWPSVCNCPWAVFAFLTLDQKLSQQTPLLSLLFWMRGFGRGSVWPDWSGEKRHCLQMFLHRCYLQVSLVLEFLLVQQLFLLPPFFLSFSFLSPYPFCYLLMLFLQFLYPPPAFLPTEMRLVPIPPAVLTFAPTILGQMSFEVAGRTRLPFPFTNLNRFDRRLFVWECLNWL